MATTVKIQFNRFRTISKIDLGIAYDGKYLKIDLNFFINDLRFMGF